MRAEIIASLGVHPCIQHPSHPPAHLLSLRADLRRPHKCASMRRMVTYDSVHARPTLLSDMHVLHALRFADGSAVCWGTNTNGALGNGGVAIAYKPTLVSGGHLYSSISCGYLYTCALLKDGSAMCW